jgi:MinD-like ATPase involved in chromosome partitioning or flagellar assembly
MTADSPAGQPPGRIITFYSYKGGTGRSMALANVAWILASAGKRVAVIDWDLEAPGLHLYFNPFLKDPRLEQTRGVLEFAIDYTTAALTGRGSEASSNGEWYRRYANLLHYAMSVNYDFPSPGLLDFIPAGRQDAAYSLKVNGFDWRDFYERLGGGVLMEAAREKLRREYDYILIDSRTGISDTAGICTVQMPDDLVVCFTFNSQSIQGAAAAARSAFRQRFTPDGSPGLRIWPVPTRVVMDEKERLDAAREVAYEAFDELLVHLSEAERHRYWGRIEVPYQSFYAFEEVLATFGDRPQHAGSMLAAMEAITDYITDGSVPGFVELEDTKRLALLSRYTRPRKQRAAPAESRRRGGIFISTSSIDQRDTMAREFVTQVRSELELRLGFQPDVFWAEEDVAGGDVRQQLMERLMGSDVLLAMLSPAYVRSPWCMQELEAAAGFGKQIFPVNWIGGWQKAGDLSLLDRQIWGP